MTTGNEARTIIAKLKGLGYRVVRGESLKNLPYDDSRPEGYDPKRYYILRPADTNRPTNGGSGHRTQDKAWTSAALLENML